MISLRVFAGAAMGAAVAGFAAGVLTRDPEVVAPGDPPPGSVEAAPVEPLPPALFSGAERPRVPAGILARAANARTLERGSSCPPGPVPEEPPRCAPEQLEPIEIEWHVAPQDP